jgi:hypothetical protein
VPKIGRSAVRPCGRLSLSLSQRLSRARAGFERKSPQRLLGSASSLTLRLSAGLLISFPRIQPVPPAKSCRLSFHEDAPDALINLEP